MTIPPSASTLQHDLQLSEPPSSPLELPGIASRTLGRPVARVMLLDENWPQTGYLIAALWKAGIEVTLLSTGAADGIALARMCEQIRTPMPSSPQYASLLQEHARRIRPDLIIPLSERLIELLWSLDPPPAPIFPSTEPWQQELVMDRKKLYQLASASGVPIAPSMDLTGPQDLPAAADLLGYPFVLRGTAGCAGSQVRLVHTAQDAGGAYEQLRLISPGALFAQAFVAGHRQLFGGVFLHGEALRCYGQMTLQRWPRETSPSIRVLTVRDATMERHTRTLMRQLRWTGIGCAEYIKRETGELIFLEINIRPWAALGAAERSNAGICRAFANMLSARPITPRCTYRAGVDVILTEGFVIARRRESLWRTMRQLNWREGYGCLRTIPWSTPWLALHILRRVYRACS